MHVDPRGERGSAPAEFVMVSALLTALTLAVMQLGFAVYVRNVVQDAAVEAAHYAALADVDLAAGESRARDAVTRALGADVLDAVVVEETVAGGARMVVVTLRATLPIIGLVGAPEGTEAVAHAPVETVG
ncbi:TadE/TadG family type IV pilus assembly protein [Microbacterium indicum]|uniref:TadE/TadG family type IV pilus assembly protein n=1 Tax=Microbacterium indicum TaxID=358100 RepID=UPI00056B4783|nr:TadE/TadG family type IV pilus assembly protein [Microbacterium indicum]